MLASGAVLRRHLVLHAEDDAVGAETRADGRAAAALKKHVCEADVSLFCRFHVEKLAEIAPVEPRMPHLDRGIRRESEERRGDDARRGRVKRRLVRVGQQEGRDGQLERRVVERRVLVLVLGRPFTRRGALATAARRAQGRRVPPRRRAALDHFTLPRGLRVAEEK